MKSRVVVCFIFLVGMWTLLFMRAATLQILPNDRLEKLKQKQFNTLITLKSRRGSILDRNGRELALSARAYSLYADPSLVDGHKRTAKKLAKELRVTVSSIDSKLRDSKKRFVWIQRLLSESQYQKIKAWDLKGISFVEEWKRVYPNESIFSQSLGFLGTEGQALEGLELSLDKELTGNTKKIQVRRDALGRPLIIDGLMFAENPDGNDVYLTIDLDLQYNLETQLQKVVRDQSAEGAFGVILDAKTSEVLAMAASPTFDVNKALSTPANLRRNSIVSDAMEPGSTIKTFIIAMALKDGLLKPNKKYFCENGSYKIGNRVIREAEASHRFGELTVSEILALSSNIGVAKIAMELGENRVQSGLVEFGFGSRVGQNFPAESKGIMQNLPWSDHLLANVSFGQGIAVTPLQMAAAYAAIAHDGEWRMPAVVKGFRSAEASQMTEMPATKPQILMSKEDSNTMRMMLSGVTQKGGTGVNARVEGFMVAGKTGTAQISNPKGRGYLPGAYLSSFAGFVPANDPKFVIYVGVSQPKRAYYGSQVGAPLFSEIASYAVRKEGLLPSNLSTDQLTKSFLPKPTVSPAISKTLLPNTMLAKTTGLKTTGLNSAFQSDLKTQDTDTTSTDSELDVRVPDLKNLSLREVIRRTKNLDVKLKIRGQGLVTQTYPESGSLIPEDRKIILFMKR